jgi:hypothetical protein
MNRRAAVAGVIDVAVLVGFALAGRRSHGTGDAVADVVTVAAPFLIGLAAGWSVTRLWRHPTAWRPAIPAWLITLATGFTLRALVWDRGLAPGFLVVATAFTGAALVGWRLLVRAVGPQWAPVRSRQRPG